MTLKLLLVSSLDKSTSKTNEIFNFRPVSILTTFSKAYETVAKRSLEAHMNKFLSLFYNNYATGKVFMDLSKAFDCIFYDLLIVKLDAYDFNRNLVRYIHSYLEIEKQSAIVVSVGKQLTTVISVEK